MKEESNSNLIDDITSLAVKHKEVLLGAVVGYLASSKIEEHPEIRNAILGAVIGKESIKSLSDGKKGDN